MANKNNKKKQYKTLLSVLANGSTEQSLDLLKRHSGETAQNTKDLEVKLARLYAISTSKPEIEKEFAEIHPHKDFILRYVKAKEELKPLKPMEEPKPEQPLQPKQMTVVHDGYANAEGCGCNCPRCTGAYSNAIGEQPSGSNAQSDKSVMVVGIVSVVAILGMVLYLSKNK